MEPDFHMKQMDITGCVFPTGNVIVDDTLYMYTMVALIALCLFATCPQKF